MLAVETAFWTINAIRAPRGIGRTKNEESDSVRRHTRQTLLGRDRRVVVTQMLDSHGFDDVLLDKNPPRQD